MMHPVLGLLATQPHLLLEHAEAYADLVADDIGAVSTGWKRRLTFVAAALCCAGVAAVLTGVAVMLWAITPEVRAQTPWALIIVPLLPTLATLACLMAARAAGSRSAFHNVRQQVQADMAMLREVSQK